MLNLILAKLNEAQDAKTTARSQDANHTHDNTGSTPSQQNQSHASSHSHNSSKKSSSKNG